MMSQFTYMRDDTNWIASDGVKLGDSRFHLADIHDVKLGFQYAAAYYLLRNAMFATGGLTAALVLSYPSLRSVGIIQSRTNSFSVSELVYFGAVACLCFLILLLIVGMLTLSTVRAIDILILDPTGWHKVLSCTDAEYARKLVVTIQQAKRGLLPEK